MEPKSEIYQRKTKTLKDYYRKSVNFASYITINYITKHSEDF
jgi:hypothetical protein